MKKTILMLCVACALTVTTTYAQDQPKQKTETGDSKTKVKPKTTVGDKAHNVIHPKNKRSHGTKVKHKTDAGKTKKETETGNQ
jgi:Ni/Co efflux regulator RcnB